MDIDAGHFGVPLDLANVLARRAEGEPEVHIPGAADRLLEHLVATKENALADDGIVMALAPRRSAGDHYQGRTGGAGRQLH